MHAAGLVLATVAACLAGCAGGGGKVAETFRYREFAVAADHPVASEAGAAMLARGGNAVDAAVAASFCLSVVRPYSCGIGGGGFMVIFDPAREGRGSRTIAINYREVAPAAVGPAYYRDRPEDASTYGPHAIGVPGTVAGLLHALEAYGTLDRATVLEPAIRAAEEGFAADANFVAAFETLLDRAAEHADVAPTAAAMIDMLAPDGALEVGELVRNPAQARALRLIARRGREAFYEGPIGEAIVEVARATGGALSAADLATYSIDVTPPLVEAVRLPDGRRGAGAREFTVVTMPPPSSGGVAIVQALGILERRAAAWRGADPDEPRFVHLVTEAMKHAFADRAAFLADPRYVDVPTAALLEPAYLDALADAVSTRRTHAPERYGRAAALAPDGGTSHLSIVDADGMAVSCTETINLYFGSLVAVPEYGFFLNNEMDDFTRVPGAINAFGLRQSEANLPEPGKRPLSSMTPTIVVEDGRAALVVGASGGPRIITATLQVILRSLVFDSPTGEAVSAARFHHQWRPNVLEVESSLGDRGLITALRATGHEVRETEDVGVVQAVRVREDFIEAASDPRKGGRPAGR